MRINFDFADLEAFLALAELGSFQRAAHQLNVSQPALTRRIQKLEGSLGVTLFERTTRSLKLTLAAKGLRNRAQAMLDDAAETVLALRDETSRFEHQRNAIITVAAIPTATQNILPGAIKLFRSRGHSARIRILDHLAGNVADAVAQGDADFGVSFLPAEEPGISFNTLVNDRFVLAMRHDDPLCRKRSLRWSDIDETRFIAPWKGTGNRMLIDDALARSHQSLNWAFEVRRSSTQLGLVEAGIGVAVLPEIAIPTVENALVVSRPLVDPVVMRAIGTVRRTSQSMPRAAEQFFQILMEMF
jgi:DNA-binding transcriptional LysR family regulator